MLSRERLGALQFAGATFLQDVDVVGVDLPLGALQPRVPPICSRKLEHAVHLRCDLFRNDCMVRRRSEAVPVPRIHRGREANAGVDPWLRAASLAARRPGRGMTWDLFV